MGRDKICHEIMAATGCDYTAAMRARDLRWADKTIDAYLYAMRQLPPRPDGELRCARCFEPAAAKHSCRKAA